MAAPASSASSAPSDSTSATPTSSTLTAQQQEWMDDPQAAFELGVELAFERWEDLNMSVEHGWCGGTEVGEQLRDELIDATIDWFYSAKEKLHWDEVSDFLFDALSEQFHVQSETREEEHIARLLTTLYSDCLERKDFTGLQRMMEARRQVFKARADARRKVREELAEDDEEEEEDGEEGWDGEDGEVEDEEDETGGERGLEQRMERMAVAEGKEEEESKSGAVDEAKEAKTERTAEEEDGWTTVGGKQKSKKKGR